MALFWTRVNKDGPIPECAPHLGPCWVFTNKLDPDGYGKFTLRGKTRRAHQIAYELVVGEIPVGLVPDHLCRVRHCVNPGHIEWVTDRENILRGISPPARNARKTHCPRGHEYTVVNTYVDRLGKRHCKACWPINKEMRKARVATLAKPINAEPTGGSVSVSGGDVR